MQCGETLGLARRLAALRSGRLAKWRSATMKLAWIELHKDDLMADSQLAVSGQLPYKIEPLR